MKRETIATVVAAITIAAALATPAAAATRKHHQAAQTQTQAIPREQFNQVLPGGNAIGSNGPDPIGVYVGGKLVGRDPDPNIRSMIERQYNYSYHPGVSE
jgi:hypothetical protein